MKTEIFKILCKFLNLYENLEFFRNLLNFKISRNLLNFEIFGKFQSFR